MNGKQEKASHGVPSIYLRGQKRKKSEENMTDKTRTSKTQHRRRGEVGRRKVFTAFLDTTVRFDEDQRQKLENLAKRRKTSISEQVRVLVAREMRRLAGQEQETEAS